MPNRTKKTPKRSDQSDGSHWQNFHFSGKLIVCSVIFGLMLILIGGIVLAIGMDQDDDVKSDNYEDLQKKPPMAIVGPVIMGIGGFTVIVGVFMCLVETNVCRRNNVENRSLIEHEDMNRDSAATGHEPTAVPSTSHKHRKGIARKHHQSPRKIRNSNKAYSTKDRSSGATSPSPPATLPISVIGHGSKHILSASDKFMTPPSSFTPNIHPNSRDAEMQTSSSLMKSFTSSGNSWNVSADFQTPNASSVESSISLEPNPDERFRNYLDPNSLIEKSSGFLTPKNSLVPDAPISLMQNPINSTLVANAEGSNAVSESNQSLTNDHIQIGIEKDAITNDIIEEANTQMNSDIVDETSISFQLEDKNLNTENQSSTSPLECHTENLSTTIETRGGNESHDETSEIVPNSEEPKNNTESDCKNGSNMRLELANESNKIADNLTSNKVLNQENNNTDSIDKCLDEDKNKSIDIEDKETTSQDLERKGLESEDEHSENESDTKNCNKDTADVPLPENVGMDIEHKLIDIESINNNVNPTR